jgi:hypothetical protein
LSYKGLPGVWPALLEVIGIRLEVEKVVFFACIVAMSIAMNTGKRRLPLFGQIGLLVMFFLVFAPAYAVQYLAWGVPFVVYLGAVETLTYSVIVGGSVGAIYTHWSGIPWFRAVGTDSGPIGVLWLCWLTLAALLFLFFRRLARQEPTHTEALPLETIPVSLF